MLIVCPQCAAEYRVDPAGLRAAGRPVRCVRCRNVQFARNPAALSAIAQAYRAEAEALCRSVSELHSASSSEATATTPANPTTDHSPAEVNIEAEEMPPVIAPEAILAAPSLTHSAETPACSLQPHEALAIFRALTSVEPCTVPPTAAPLGKQIETCSARQSPRRAGRAQPTTRRSSRPSYWPRPLTLAIWALVAINVALIGWRSDVVRVAPQTASLYAAIGLPVNLRGLLFTEIKTTAETQDGVQVLVVEGTISSVSPHLTEVPRLRLSVRNQAGHDVYAWIALPERSALSPGETLAFRSRLASPPPEVREVMVRFLNHHDRGTDL